MQSNLNLGDYIRRARDRFVYLQLYAPSFPPEDRTNCAAEFEKQRVYIQEISRRSRSENRRRWLVIVLRELDEAFSVYEKGDRDKGLKLLYEAERHYRDAMHGSSFEPTFITDENGQTKRVEDTGNGGTKASEENDDEVDL